MRKNRSDAVHIMMSCQALASHNTEVTLVTPMVKRRDYDTKFSEIFDIYGLDKSFNILELQTNINEESPAIYLFFSTVFQKFFHYFRFYLKNKKVFSSEATIVYSQCFISSLPYIFLRKSGVVSSKHVFTAAAINEKSYLHKYIMRNSDLIISGLKYTVADIIKFTGIDKDKFIDTPLLFLSNKMLVNFDKDKEECRRNIGFNEDKKYIVYAGKTAINAKNVENFIECAEHLGNYNFVIVGANKTTMPYYKQIIADRKIMNLEIIEFLPLPKYFTYVVAADLLVDFYEPTYYNKYYLGPGKASSYFSSGNPVLFSDLPSLRHLFSEDIAFFVESQKSSIIIEKIRTILNDEVSMKLKANAAKTFAQKHSFEYTIGRILKFCESRVFNIH